MKAQTSLAINTQIHDPEYHESELQFWINDINILEYRYQSEEKTRTATGNLYMIFEYLEDSLRFIDNDTPFPHQVKGNSACELDRNARYFESDDDEEFDAFFDPLDEWSREHSWIIARLDIYLANVMFRKVDDCIEISWDNHDLYKDVQFLSLEGCVRIPCEEYRKVILKAVDDYNKLWNKE